MAITYNLAPVPKWYFADLVGRPLGGGYLVTQREQNPDVLKPVYQTPSGTLIWPYVPVPHTNRMGILFDENGMQGPFYWKVDSTDLSETYRLEVYDTDGVLQFTIPDYFPPGSGGGGNTTTIVDTQNLIANGVMWRNTGDSISPLPAYLPIAPGANTGLAYIPNSSAPSGPDIVFYKNNTSAIDQITFPPLLPIGTAFSTDVAPANYLRYVSNAGTGETVKVIQFPLTAKVQNLSNNQVTVSIWARANSGNSNITLQWRQFFGDGPSASLDVITPLPIQPLALTTNFARFDITGVIPTVGGKSLGECGNDGLFLQVLLPLDASTSIDIASVSCFLGDTAPEENYIPYDYIDGQIFTPRTGDIRQSFNFSSPFFLPSGWIPLDDGTIGNASSNATTRANEDTFPLFSMIWNSINNTNAPLLDSAGTPTARGASSVDDFVADRQITLPPTVAKVLAEQNGTTHLLGSSTGTETATLAIGNMPAHAHPGSTVGTSVGGAGAPANSVIQSATAVGNAFGLTIASQGSGTPFSILQPTTYVNYIIKL